MSVPEKARIGLVGRILDATEQQVEADPVAIAACFLTAFGNVVGRRGTGEGPHIKVGPVRHNPNLFTVLVGDSAEGRKGEAWAVIERIFERAAPEWMEQCLLGGFASGEALIRSLYESSDRRRLVVEPELASVIGRAGREGSILSAVLRQSFDGSALENRRAAGDQVATKHHVSVVAMITPDELRQKLGGLEASNGYGSRHLFFEVRRDRNHLLPFGGDTPESLWTRLGGYVEAAVGEASQIGEIGWSEDARDGWEYFYRQPISGSGVVRALSARRDAISLRLAMIYALCDGSDEITLDHVEAAGGLWAQSQRSMLTIWRTTGDPLADRIAAALHETDDDGNSVYADEGMSLTRQREILGHNYSAKRLEQVIHLLVEMRLARVEQRATGGRPSTVLLPLFSLFSHGSLSAEYPENGQNSE